MRINAADAMKNATLEVEIYTPRAFAVRMWLAIKLIRFACFIFPFGAEVNVNQNSSRQTPPQSADPTQ